jgi:ribonuclease BN (tRNA processing enzyme)
VGLTLTVLGCDGTYAGPGGACSGYLVRSETTSLWVDAGSGTLSALQRHVALADLDAVIVTHAHPDHCLELPVLRNALRFGVGVEGLAVVTTAEVRDLVEHLTGGAEPTFAWQVVTGGDTLDLGDLHCTFAGTDHPVETLAVRVDHDSHSLVYTADTGPRFTLAGLVPAGGVDLALCEATVPADREGEAPHLSGRQAGTIAAAAGARRLVLTHLAPGSDPVARRAEAATTYDGPITVAATGVTYRIGSTDGEGADPGR